MERADGDPLFQGGDPERVLGLPERAQDPDGVNFEKKFQLADNIKIREATLKNGLLDIDLLKILPKEVKKEVINIIEK